MIQEIKELKSKMQSCEGRVELAENLKRAQRGLDPNSGDYSALQVNIDEHLYFAYCRCDNDKDHVKGLIAQKGIITASELEAAIEKYNPLIRT